VARSRRLRNTFTALAALEHRLIWLSVKRDLFIQNFLHIEKILPLMPLDFRGDHPSNYILEPIVW
jgi:hypothetical protein